MKNKVNKPKWIRLTEQYANENDIIGMSIRVNRNVQFPFTGIITELNTGPRGQHDQYRIIAFKLPKRYYPDWYSLPDRISTRYLGRLSLSAYVYYGACIYIDVNSKPKQRKFHCLSCGSPGARYKRGLCPNCNQKAF